MVYGFRQRRLNAQTIYPNLWNILKCIVIITCLSLTKKKKIIITCLSFSNVLFQDSFESKNAVCREFLGRLNESLAVLGGRFQVDAR